MRQILLKIKYIGTNFHGWQVQDNATSVQGAMQDALEAIFLERPGVIGCSRTDAGVHANEYCLTFKTESDIDCYKLKGALNSHLPDDISVFDAFDVNLDFHPRYFCKGKQYIYKIWNGESRDPFMNGRSLYYRPKIDDKLLDLAAKEFIGTYDFTSFCGSKSDIEDCKRTVYEAEVKREGDLVTFSVTGDGFLYNMVRIMVGTLLFVNEGKLQISDIKKIIEMKDRTKAGKTAPAEGLYLNKVYYGGEFGEEDKA